MELSGSNHLKPYLDELKVHVGSTILALRDEPPNIAASCILEYVVVNFALKLPGYLSTVEKIASICLLYLRASPPKLPLSSSQIIFVNRMLVLSEHSMISLELRCYIKDFIEIHCMDARSLRLHLEPTILLNCSSTFKRHTVIVLLGAPGTGKSTLGRGLHRARCIESFVDIGQRLLQRGDLVRYEQLPIPSRKSHLRMQASGLLTQEISQYLRASGELPLILTCIKETQDVYDLIELVERFREKGGLSCTLNVQAFYLHDEQMNDYDVGQYSSQLVKETQRLRKWVAHHTNILQVFTAYSSVQQYGRIKIPGKTGFSWGYDKSCPPFLPSCYRVVWSNKTRESVRIELAKLLGVGGEIDDCYPLPSCPAALLCVSEQAAWVCRSRQYSAFPHLTGDRYLLVTQKEVSWLISSAMMLYSVECDHDSHLCSEGTTVFDGVLRVACEDEQGGNIFIATDVLAHNGEAVWMQSLDDRIQILEGLVNAYDAVHGQDAIGKLRVVKIKRFNKPTADDIDKLLLMRDQDEDELYTGGIVFRLNSLPYCFGDDHMSFLWQLRTRLRVDMDSSTIYDFARHNHQSFGSKDSFYVKPLHSLTMSDDRWSLLSSMDLWSQQLLGTHPSYDTIKKLKGYVFECVWCDEKNCWLPRRLRLGRAQFSMNTAMGKAINCYNETSRSGIFYHNEHRPKLFDANDVIAHDGLLCEIFRNTIASQHDQEKVEFGPSANIFDSNQIYEDSPTAPLHIHPTRSLSFAALLSCVDELVSLQKVERWVDADTGLHVYSYVKTSVEELSSLDMNMCRGLVLHPPSATIVANSFVKFPTLEDVNIDAYPADSSRARASLKYDGSLLIAFVWRGVIYATTKRRMDSEQAIFGTKMLRANDSIAAEVKEGWTYMFELIGGNNMHIVSYPAQRLILLSVYDGSGAEVSLAEKRRISVRMQVSLTPFVYGSFAELSRLVSGPSSLMYRFPRIQTKHCFDNSMGYNVDDEDNYPLFNEGWVIEDLDRGGRFKSIDPGWRIACRAVKNLVHPVSVWSYSLNDSLQKLFNNPHLPRHAVKEIHRISESLMSSFEAPLFDLALSTTHKCLIDEYQSTRDNYFTWRETGNRIGVKDATDGVSSSIIGKRHAVAGESDNDDDRNKRLRMRLMRRCTKCGCTSELDSLGDRICFCDPCFGSGNPCDLVRSDVHPCGIKFPLEGNSEFESANVLNAGCAQCGCIAEFDEHGDRTCFCDSCFGKKENCSTTLKENKSLDGSEVLRFCAAYPCVRCGCEISDSINYHQMRNHGSRRKCKCQCQSCVELGCQSMLQYLVGGESVGFDYLAHRHDEISQHEICRAVFPMSVANEATLQTMPLCDIDLLCSKHLLVSACEWCGCQREWDEEGNRVCFCDCCFGSSKPCHLIDMSKLVCDNALLTRELYLAMNKSDLCAFVRALGDAEYCGTSIDILKLCEAYEALALFSMSRKSLTKKSLLIRYLLLHNSRPSPRGELSQYVPSQWLAQTFAKGWVCPGYVHRAKASLTWDVNTDSSLNAFFAGGDSASHIFSFLVDTEICYRHGAIGRHDLSELRLVCRLWNHIISNCFRDDITKARHKHNNAKLEENRLLCRSWDYDDEMGYGS